MSLAMLESVDDLVIERSNFAQNRKSYGITLKEIADKSKISPSVISNYENYTGQYTQTRIRDDNERAIVRALKELIQNKIDETFIVPIIKKEDKGDMVANEITLDELVKETKAKEISATKKFYPGYNKASIVKDLRDYCRSNAITMTEFCKMCGVAHSTMTPSSIKVASTLSENVLLKICKATGWDIERFSKYYVGDKDVAPIPKEKKEEPIITPVTQETKDTLKKNKIIEELPERVGEIKDKKYTFQDGKFYEEYIVVIEQHIRKEISRTEFLSAVQ